MPEARKPVTRLIFLVGAVIVSTLFIVVTTDGSEPIPKSTSLFLTGHCFECHGGDESEGGVHFDLKEINWQEGDSSDLWERVYNVLTRNEMPPSDAEQPTEGERNQVVDWLEARLLQHANSGGTVLRRLNREEYENTIRDLFDMPEFQVPNAFPADDSGHGFDNIGEALILSPPLLSQYLELATQIADEILPPDRGPLVAKPAQYDIGAAGLGESNGTSVEGDRFRITVSKSNADTAGWPARFEAPQSGVYRLTVGASAYQTDKMYYAQSEEPFRLSVYAKLKTEQTYDAFENIRKVAQFDVHPNRDTPQAFTREIVLNKGESFGLRWENGPFASNDSPRMRMERDPKARAAMMQLGKDPRGMSRAQYYDETIALMNSEKLDMEDPRLKEPVGKIGGLFGGGGKHRVMAHWYMGEEFRRFGPALDVTDVSIEGPFRLVEDEETRVRKARTARFLGRRKAGDTDQEYIEAVLRRFLPRAFRHPVTVEQVQPYVDVAMQEINAPDSSGRIEDGLHVALRRALTSPNFIYRGIRPGRLNDFDVASRLSYFLTSGPPDDRLFDLASRGELSDPEVLARETLRLLKGPRSQYFVSRFTGQWLGTRALHDIMPDPRLFFYHEGHRRAMTHEVEMLFTEILRENLTLATFIDPGFSYRNRQLNAIYGDDLEGEDMQRVEFERGSRQGGVLGLAAVMMATANGVDTHPVQRGVWLLENVFGTPTPEPPTNVPAIAVDTSGATTMRTLVETHREDQSCARCHDKIDPLGMVLENFDPVGRWRDHYPIYTQPADGEEALKEQFYSNTGKGTEAGPAVDSAGILEDGTHLQDVTDLKRYLTKNIDIFSRCLAGKLLVYATGRPMSFGDQRVIDQVVDDVKREGNGFRDLVVAIVLSESFGMK
ncbi:MAG: DUF1592 domain-containing protein [Planctomycetota bacterium]|jgi:hypothetical protein